MKKITISLSLAALFSANLSADESLRAELEELKKQVKELQDIQKKVDVESLQKQFLEVKAHDANDNVKFSIDFRTAYDIVDYKIANVKSLDNGIWTNKLILGMAARPLDDLIFKGKLSVYKAFGNNTSFASNGYQNMDWYASNAPSDTNLRLQEAYFLYTGEAGDLGYTASFGRRPSINGFLVNLRDDDEVASPIGHNINMEFDGASFMFDFDKLTGISGLYFKLCLGRGNSNADAKYPTFTGYPFQAIMPSSVYAPYVKSNFDSANMDLIGLVAQLYDNGQFKAMFNYFQGFNMMGANFNLRNPQDPRAGYVANMVDVGDLSGGAIALQITGLSDEIDFLMDTILFASFAWSQTEPKGTHNVLDMNPRSPTFGQPVSVKEMLGSSKKETGTSYYIGAQVPGFFEGDKFGLEYNHGSKYWRSFTYGEDTLVGSKLATRGNAYEAYYIKPLLGDHLVFQLRYTLLDYDYTGSDMYFGSTGTPMKVSDLVAMGQPVVEKASNIRAYIRYRY